VITACILISVGVLAVMVAIGLMVAEGRGTNPQRPPVLFLAGLILAIVGMVCFHEGIGDLRKWETAHQHRSQP
jgi:hypothetical protein